MSPLSRHRWCPDPLPPTPWGDRRRVRIGLLGGSFNPAHAGHRHISVLALQRLNLDEVWWLVAPQNPLKARNGMAPLAHRLSGARRVACHPRIRVTDLERALGTRYTVATLAALQRRFPRARLVWLMGADNLVQLPRWRAWEDLVRRIPIAVFDRPHYSLKAVTGKAARRFADARIPGPALGHLADQTPPAWGFLPIPLHPESATRLRHQGRTDP